MTTFFGCVSLYFTFFAFIQSAKLKKLPPFMTVSLLRFSFDFAKCERYKETGRYSFPITINLQPFCEQVLDLRLCTFTITFLGCFLSFFIAFQMCVHAKMP